MDLSAQTKIRDIIQQFFPLVETQSQPQIMQFRSDKSKELALINILAPKGTFNNSAM